MRILMLAPYPDVRGPLPKLVPPLAAALRDLGCSVRVEGWGRRREDETRAEKIAGRIADIGRVRKIMRAEHFDMLVVHTSHDWNTLGRDLPLLAATRTLGVSSVLHLHGSWADRLARPGHAALKTASAALVRLSDALLVLSAEEQRQWLALRPRARVHVVKNPFLPAPEPIPDPGRVADGVPVLLFVGRLIDAKGVWDLLEALRAVLADTPCRLVLAGEGEAAEEFERRTREAALARHVTLAGYLEGEQLQRAYAAADCFVLPSHTEGFPSSILEAMSAGLPIVTTRIRGMADHLREGVNALMVEPRDVAALAEALRRVLSDAQLRARMGAANREKVREFAPEVVGREYLAILHSVARRVPREDR